MFSLSYYLQSKAPEHKALEKTRMSVSILWKGWLPDMGGKVQEKEKRRIEIERGREK